MIQLLRFWPIPASLIGAAAYSVAVYQWGAASAGKANAEDERDRIVQTMDAQIAQLNDRVQISQARAREDAESLDRLDAILNDFNPEPLHATPLAPDCPPPAYSTRRVRDAGHAINDALGYSVSPPGASDGAAVGDSRLPGDDGRADDAHSP